MKEGWTAGHLADLCEFQRGLTYAKSDEVESSANVVLRANNIDLVTNSLNLSELKYIGDHVQVPATKIVCPQSLLICTASGSKSHLGKVAYIDDDYGYAFGGFMGQLTPGKALLPKFLFHLMTSEAYKGFIEALSDGANINNLKFDDLGRFLVPIPPLPEQQRIVALLDEAFAALASAQAHAARNLQNARALFDSQLQSVFSQRGKGWVETTLGDAYDVRDGTHDSPRYQNSGYPLITSKNLKPDGLSFEDVRLISEQDYHKINERSAVHKGDVLFAMIGSIGNPTLVNVEPDFAIKNVALFKSTKGHIGAFLRYYFSSPKVAKKMIEDAKGSTQKFVGLGYLRSFPISLPSHETQSAIVVELDKLAGETQRLAQIYEQKQAALAALKQALLHQAFHGEL